MPDAIELLKTRRSMKPREMTGPGPSPAELETILTIGARVPDHGKLAPWRFIVFEGDGRALAGDVIAKVFAKKNPGAPTTDIEVEKRRLTDAPLVIGVVGITNPRRGVEGERCSGGQLYGVREPAVEHVRASTRTSRHPLSQEA